MTIQEYSERAWATAAFPAEPTLDGIALYPFFGLGGETGEILEKLKKCMRDSGAVIDETKKLELKKELGDVAWYLNACSLVLGLTLEDVFITNLLKLESRKERGVICGSGDNR